METNNNDEISVDVLKPKEQPAILAKAYNRKQARTAAAIGMKVERVARVTKVEKEKREFKAYRKELARKHGSTTGELKKKHINRERILNAIEGLNNE